MVVRRLDWLRILTAVGIGATIFFGIDAFLWRRRLAAQAQEAEDNRWKLQIGATSLRDYYRAHGITGPLTYLDVEELGGQPLSVGDTWTWDLSLQVPEYTLKYWP